MSKIAKVPVIMQQEAVECGAASLSMMCAYYKKWVTLEKVRADCGVSRDGSSAKNILLVARQYGFEAQGYRMEVEHLKNADFPCIIHWNFNHFVVLCGFSKDTAIINDPARGQVRVSKEEFDKAFTGITISIKPAPGFVPSGEPPSVIAFARERLRGTLSATLFIVFAGLIGAVIRIIMPLFSRVFIDDLLTGNRPDWLVYFVWLFAFMILMSTILAVLQTNQNFKIKAKFAVVANGMFMWHVLRLPVHFFATRYAGDIVARQASNENITSSLLDDIAPLFLDLGLLVFYLVVMLRYSVMLTLIGLATALLNVILGDMIAKKRIHIARLQMRDSGKLYSTTMSGIEMIETIKSSGAEDGFFEKWSGYHAAVNTAQVRMYSINGYLGSLPSILSVLSSALTLGLGVYLIMSGAFTIGMLLSFQGLLASFMTPVSNILGVRQSILELRTAMERVSDVMNYKTDVAFSDVVAEDKEYAKLRGKVELKNVTFGYNKLSPPLIKDFSLTLEPGSRVALVGGSGCGKSTIAKLVSGLYTPWSGEILFDGTPISEISREVFTSSVAVVDQEITLFEDTIDDNIKMWDSTIEDFEVILAARDAQIHTTILSREDGYRSKICEGGRNLSGGERQRIEIARTLAIDPTIIIMDEATSALDAKTEFDLINAVKDRGISCIIIAHRLSTIRDCDEIIVLDRGNVVERGTHTTLYAQDGKYRKLVASN